MGGTEAICCVQIMNENTLINVVAYRIVSVLFNSNQHPIHIVDCFYHRCSIALHIHLVILRIVYHVDVSSDDRAKISDYVPTPPCPPAERLPFAKQRGEQPGGALECFCKVHAVINARGVYHKIQYAFYENRQAGCFLINASSGSVPEFAELWWILACRNGEVCVDRVVICIEHMGQYFYARKMSSSKHISKRVMMVVDRVHQC